jgi:hypothetical protein
MHAIFPMMIDTHKTLDADDVLQVYVWLQWRWDAPRRMFGGRICTRGIFSGRCFPTVKSCGSQSSGASRDAWAFVLPRWARIHHLPCFARFWVAGARARLYWRDDGDEPAIMVDIELVAMVLNVVGTYSLSTHVCIK